MRSKILRLLGRKHVSPTREARIWSNEIVRKIAPHVTGDVVNISAWRDQDKEGSSYRKYFTNANSYSTTNFQGWRGEDGITDHELDLLKPAPVELREKFDVVYNHTTLEHVYDFVRALDTMNEMARDAILIVVPWMQHLHGPDDSDFWRFSPYAMRRLFNERGFDIVVEAAGPDRAKVVYLTYFASRRAAYWEERLSSFGNDAVTIAERAL